jgi:hypothetical protein
MEIPTIKQFNQWEASKKIDWIKSEIEGDKPTPGYGGFLIYPQKNMGIRYITDQANNITEATAMQLGELMAMMVRHNQFSSTFHPNQMN